MNKPMLNGFALGNLTGLAAAFVLFTVLPGDWWRFAPGEDVVEELPPFIMLDFQQRLDDLQRELREKEQELEALREAMKDQETPVEARVPILIDGEDRSKEYAMRYEEQRAERVHGLVVELTQALGLNRRVQEVLRSAASAELSTPGRDPYQPILLAEGSAVRLRLEPHLSPAQVELLETHVRERVVQRQAERARVWWLQVESIIELEPERRARLRERLGVLAGPEDDTAGEAGAPAVLPLEELADFFSPAELEKLRSGTAG